ncbi:hypothetical protein F4801DRAFT_571068 [Xylaria longipes]|nr:hypothetical protein F4801DRAFT_571068 [Xylaria longipes]RYC54987.1 hypothetical protein CHU98_g11227 [Xylaria longipes]
MAFRYSLAHLFGLHALFLNLVVGYLIDPPTTADPATVSDCSNWVVISNGDTCQTIADDYFITVEDFSDYNPSVDSSCKLVVGNSYCTERNFGIPPPVTTTTTTSTTSAGNGVSTPTPTQTGMTKSCNKFHKVVSGDTCSDLSVANGISLADFYSWNPDVGSTCALLILDYYVCVGTIGGSTPTTTTSPGNGIATPTPTQTGMTKSCNKFHKVVSGDSCSDLATSNGISLSDFYSWNPDVGSTCALLILDYYVCIGVIGGTTTTKPTSTTTTGNGIATPTPTQPNMTHNCNRFYKVKSGDLCYNIAASNGISVDQIYSWNPDVGDSCQFLYLDYYICIGVVGFTPTTTTTTPTTTTRGNGVATPTPTQSGMVGNCKAFHKVVSGDICDTVASAAKITVTQFYAWNPAVGTDCSHLNIGYYVCIGLI